MPGPPCLITVTGLKTGPSTQGDVVRVAAKFTDTAGTDVDPTTVVFKVRKPDGAKTTYTYGVGATIAKSSVGDYYVNFELADPGTYTFRWQGSGNYQGAVELTQAVSRSVF